MLLKHILHSESDTSHSSWCNSGFGSERVSEGEGFNFIRYRELLRGKQAATGIGCIVRTKGIRSLSMNINKEGSREEGIS